jgi:uncharacterized protein YprB with RNaseH-like and TPR domain
VRGDGRANVVVAGEAGMRIAYLDIETTYTGRFTDQRVFKDRKNHRITVLGMRAIHQDKDSFLQLVGNEVSKTALLNALRGMELIVTYNGRSIPDEVKRCTGFDFPIIASQLGVVLDREFKHLDLCPVCWQRGLWGGQKTIERLLGLERKLPDMDGGWADAAWKRYEKSRDESILKNLLEYNREDVFMLHRIREVLNSTQRQSQTENGVASVPAAPPVDAPPTGQQLVPSGPALDVGVSPEESTACER